MAASRLNRYASMLARRKHLLASVVSYSYTPTTRTARNLRGFHVTAARQRQYPHRKETFSSRLRTALRKTPIRWRPIPVSLGIGFLGVWQFYKIQQQDKERQWEQERGFHTSPEYDAQGNPRPPRRERIRPSGPWQVQVMSTLPLKAISRLWGRFNELNIPHSLRVPGFKLYSWIFGVKYTFSRTLIYQHT